MSGKIDFESFEGLPEDAAPSPSHTRSFTEKLLPQRDTSKDFLESYEGLTEEDTSTFWDKTKEGAIETAKAPLRATGRTLATTAAASFKGIGDALVAFSNIGVKSQEGDIIRGKGTELIKDFGSFLGQFGRANETFMKGEIEKYLGKSSTSLEEGLTKAAERSGNILGQFPTRGMVIPALMGGVFGQTAEELGFGEDAQQVAEMTGMLAKDVGKLALKLFQKEGAGMKLLNMLKKNPQATGELTGLAGTQLEAFNALSDAEKASYLKNLGEKEIQLRAGIKGEEVGAKALEGQQQAPGRSLQGRVSAAGEDVGIRPGDTGVRPASTAEGNLENVLNRVHVNELGNKRQAGQALKNTIMESDNAAYQNVNDLYARSRELNEGINGSHQQLANQLQNRLEELNRIPRPSSVQRNLINALEVIIDELAIVRDGTIVGYRNVNNQVLIDQIQSLRQTVDFDFEHGSPKGIFRPTIADIQESVYTAARGEGAEALREANTAYREWTTNYNNDYINPYRDRSNRSYEKLLEKNMNPDHFNVVNQLVGDTPQGNEILRASQREIVEKKLKKFVDNPALVRSRDFRRAMTDLESVLSPEQLNAVRTEMESQVPQRLRGDVTAHKIPTRAKAAKEIETFTKEAKAAAKYSDKTPAEIRKLSNTPEGIQQLKKDLSRTPNGKDIFDKLAKEKIQSIVKGEKVRGIPSGKEMYKIINQEKNYALIESLTSKEEATAALDIAEKLAKKKFTKENIAKIGKFYSKYKILHFLIL